MPEGDTLYCIASRLRPVLEGKQLCDARGGWQAPEAAALTGATVSCVEAIGKHLVIALADGRAVHSHLGMTGSWHIYLPREPWKKPTKRAALVLSTTDHVVVNFSPKTLEITTERELKRNSYLQQLGPDLMAPDFDPQAALLRYRRRPHLPIGVAVMDQTLARGIGNIYKSETLFLCGVDPWRRVGDFEDDELIHLLKTAHRLMRRNRFGSRRTTRSAGDGQLLWAYGRRGEACFRCGDTILLRRQGDLGRTTYWCPTCQPSADRPIPEAESTRQRRLPPIKGCS